MQDEDMRMNAYGMSARRVHAGKRDRSRYSSERLPGFQQMAFYYIIIASKHDELLTSIQELCRIINSALGIELKSARKCAGHKPWKTFDALEHHLKGDTVSNSNHFFYGGHYNFKCTSLSWRSNNTDHSYPLRHLRFSSCPVWDGEPVNTWVCLYIS